MTQQKRELSGELKNSLGMAEGLIKRAVDMASSTSGPEQAGHMNNANALKTIKVSLMEQLDLYPNDRLHLREIVMNRRLVALTGAWGTRHGGINTFNTGLMKALGRIADGKYKIVCPVQDAAPEMRNDVWRKHKVELIETGLAMDDMSEPALNKLGSLLGLERDEDAKTRSATVWLGHDDKTGSVAIALRRRFGGRAILINHMNHGSYQGFKKGDSSIAQQKKTMQRNLFSQADFCFAVGPRLTNELCQLLSVEPNAPGVAMLVPGLDDPMDYAGCGPNRAAVRPSMS